MFLVICQSPLDENWEYRDGKIYQAAGRRSNEAGATVSSETSPGYREHIWYCVEFEDAVALKNRLWKVQGVVASLRER